MNEDIAIKVEGVSKAFKLPHEKTTSIKSALVNFRKQRTYEKQLALKDISFEVKKGEFFGIVGRNGSGKSTLLKLLAGIYEPNKGTIRVNGKLTPFIELGVGFNPELTGRENVFLNGALLGFSRKEMSAMYGDIVEFAEIEKFMDQKLKNYSSGMQVRLAFSIAIRAKSDILLIDEVLAVGDAAFQQKCYDVFEKLKAKKRTIVFVSHDMAAVKRYCERAVLIESGELIKVGNPTEIAKDYDDMNSVKVDIETTKENIKKAKKSVLDVGICDKSGKSKTMFGYGETMRVRMTWPKDMSVKNAGVAIYKQTGEYIFGANTILDKVKVSSNQLDYSVSLEMGAGKYFTVLGLFGKNEKDILELVSDGPSFTVIPIMNAKWEGQMYLGHEWGSKDV